MQNIQNRDRASFHTIKHTGAVTMVKSGRVGMKEISVYLGHKSVNVTERVYAKYSPNFMKESANLMGILFLETGANSII